MQKFSRKNNDLEQKTIDVRRVARVVAGGRRFTFRVALVVGDKKGRVGVGVAKGADTSMAIDKAYNVAKKNSIKIGLTKDFSIPHESFAKYASAQILLMPAEKGHGLVAGSSARTVLELAGVKEISAKFFSRTKNKINNARAVIQALSRFEVKDK